MGHPHPRSRRESGWLPRLATAEGGRTDVDENEVIASYRVAEYASRSSNGAPLCWPPFPELIEGKVAFSTPYASSCPGIGERC